MSVFIITPILVIIIILLLTIILLGIFFTIDTFLDLPYVATKRDKIETIIKLAQIKPKETVVDLGSGDGRLIFAAARAGAHAIGYEINPFLILLTQIKAILFHPRGESLRHPPHWQRQQTSQIHRRQSGSRLVQRTTRR